jgi:hypothetical protein
LSWEGEQTYIPLHADGRASGLIVVNLDGGRLYGTGVPTSWTWLDRDNDFQPPDRDCAPHPITGKELDLDGDGDVDLVETFEILDPLFYEARPGA